jgi:tetratricopeptide (TPR) repeat protein
MARSYNNTGIDDLAQGNIAAAQQAFLRAAALDPDLVVPSYNLAEIYVQIGALDTALSWYQRAIERDTNFVAAYRGLGHLYNLQGKPANAERTLLAGLDLATSDTATQGDALAAAPRYTLLADLGWALFAQQRLARAQEALEEALQLEQRIAAHQPPGTEYRIALPHSLLAQIYEQQGRRDDARRQWEDTVRLLDTQSWRDREQLAVARDHLHQLEEQKP